MSFLDRFLGWVADFKQRHSQSTLYPQTMSSTSYAGVDVSVNQAMTLSAVWACVRRLSETVATMPIQMFERTDQGRRAISYSDHPLYFVLHDSPNYDMTAIEFWQAVCVSVELWGNAYAVKQMANGEIIGLDLLRANCMQVRRLSDGRIEFRYSDGRNRNVYYDDEVFHVKGMTLDGVKGLSTISYMRNTVGIGLATEQSAGDVFKNGMRPSGVFRIPHKLTEAQRQEAYKKAEKFKADRNGGILVTELGEEFQAISINPEDAELLATRSWSVEEVCRWFGVPPYLVGYTEKSTSWGTGMEQQNMAYLTYTILPRIRKIEQAIEKTLLTPSERRRFFIRFNYEGLLRADSKTRAEVNAMDVRNGIRSRNEVRTKENLDPYNGGDAYTIEANLATVDKVISGENLKNNQTTKAQNE